MLIVNPGIKQKVCVAAGVPPKIQNIIKFGVRENDG